MIMRLHNFWVCQLQCPQYHKVLTLALKLERPKSYLEQAYKINLPHLTKTIKSITMLKTTGKTPTGNQSTETDKWVSNVLFHTQESNVDQRPAVMALAMPCTTHNDQIHHTNLSLWWKLAKQHRRWVLIKYKETRFLRQMKKPWKEQVVAVAYLEPLVDKRLK